VLRPRQRPLGEEEVRLAGLAGGDRHALKYKAAGKIEPAALTCIATAITLEEACFSKGGVWRSIGPTANRTAIAIFAEKMRIRQSLKSVRSVETGFANNISGGSRILSRCVEKWRTSATKIARGRLYRREIVRSASFALFFCANFAGFL